MSNERFDKLMKKNLESVRPAYQSQAWERFRKRLPVSGFGSWLLTYGGWVVSGLMLTGWLLTLYTLHRNQQILQQISQPKVATATTTNPANRPIHKEAITHRTDTVYIVKKTIVEHRHYYDPSLPQTQYSSRNTSTSAIEPDSQRLQTDLPSSNEVVTLSAHTSQQSVATTRPKSQKQSRKPGYSATRPTEAAQHYNETNLASEPSKNTIPSKDTVVRLQDEPLRIDSITLQSPKPDAVATNQHSHKTADELQAKTQPASQNRSPFRLSSLKPRIGIESMASANSIGIGPSVELFPMDNLGISVGVRASQLRTESHRGPDDFNAATGKEFIDQYRSYLPAQYDRIEDISIRTSLISLPITLKYYVPFHRNWSVLFQTGARFDLTTYQQVYYESYLKGDEQHHSFDTNVQSRFFHNFMFGTGIQYRTSRISAQLNPYYLYDFRPTSGTPTGNKFGITASIWLDLFK